MTRATLARLKENITKDEADIEEIKNDHDALMRIIKYYSHDVTLCEIMSGLYGFHTRRHSPQKSYKKMLDAVKEQSEKF